MSVLSNNTLAGSSGQGGAGYEIDFSLRFNPENSGHLSKTYASAGNRKTFTLSYWIKECGKGTSPSNNPHILWSGTGSATRGGFAHRGTGSDAGKLYLFNQESNSTNCSVYTNSLHRDFSAWKHIVLAVDTTQATSTNRVKIYINGVEETLNFSTTPAQNLELQINASQLHQIGRGATDDYANAYLADIQFIDGQALAATDFGETDLIGVWQPKDFTGNYITATVNDGTVWSNSLTSQYTLTNAAKAFNGSTSDQAEDWDGTFNVTRNPPYKIEFTPPSPIAYSSSVRVYSAGGPQHPYNNTISIDTGSGYGSAISVIQNNWVTVATGSGSLTKLKAEATQNGTHIRAIEIDGVILQDGTPTNSFHLDFSDTSSNAALGTDTSGNSNTWTANNLTASSGIGPGITSTVPENLTGNWTGIIGIVPSGTSGAVAVFPDGGGTAQSRGTFYWTGLTIGDTITWYGTTGGTDNRGVTGNVDETSITAPGSSLGTIQLTVNAASGSAKIDFNGTANCYGITPGPVSSEYNDALRDSPVNGDSANDTGAGGEITGNYCTWNPLGNNSVGTAQFTYSDGNLVVNNVTNAYGYVTGTIYAKSGKWYAEFVPGANLDVIYDYIGITASNSNKNYPGQVTNGFWYVGNGNKVNIGYAGSSYGATYTTGDVIGVALDLDNYTVTFYKNGVSQGVAFTGLDSSTSWTFSTGDYANSITVVNYTANFGQRAFAYPVSGYKCLNTANLPDPTIADGSTAFDSKLYSGTGSSQSITGLGFSPDLVWTKNRGASASHALYDSVRGAGELLRSNETTAEVNVSSRFTSFDSNGFSIGGTSIENNGSSNSYVSWAWSAGENSNHTYAVTVSNPGSGNKFYADGALQPTLTLAEGSTYKFDQSSGTNSTHPLRFSTTSDGTHGGGSEYTTGVTTSGTPGSAGAYTQIVIAASAPTLYAYCTAHSGMGFQINTSDTAGYTIPVGGENSAAYNQTRTWSGDWTGGFYNSSHNATKIFDGNLLTYASVTFPVPAGVTLTVSPAITGSTIRVYYSRSTSSTPCLVNGTETLPSTGAAQTFQWYTLTATSISSFKLTHDHNGESYLAAIEVDGKMLVDSGVTPATSVPSISSRIQANPSAGFSIVKFTNTTSNSSVGHGLNAKPELIIWKKTSGTSHWGVYHGSLGATKYLYLNLANAAATGSEYWNNTEPTSSVVSTKGEPNSFGSAGDTIMYCFAPVEGYSAMGSYTGNGSADGPFVSTGFRVEFLLLKGIDGAHYWAMHDSARNPYNTNDFEYLWANDAGGTGTGYDLDFLSNGFKIRNSNGNWNNSGQEYIYIAFASNPFKNSRAS